jgi:hypothetical protein
VGPEVRYSPHDRSSNRCPVWIHGYENTSPRATLATATPLLLVEPRRAARSSKSIVAGLAYLLGCFAPAQPRLAGTDYDGIARTYNSRLLEARALDCVGLGSRHWIGRG